MRIIKTQDYIAFKNRDVSMIDDNFKNILLTFFNDQKILAEKEKE